MDIWQRIFYLLSGLRLRRGIIEAMGLCACNKRKAGKSEIETALPCHSNYRLGVSLCCYWGSGHLSGADAYRPSYHISGGWIYFWAASVVVPWFMFLQGMGKGVLARNTPAPLKICAIALATHIIFGIGIAFGIQLVF